MDASSMTGVRRSYQVVDFGHFQLRHQLEVIFDGAHRPLYYLETREGVFASNDEELITTRSVGLEPRSSQSFDQAACEMVASRFVHFMGQLNMHERLVMAGGWPSDTDDFPVLEGWRLEATCSERGIILVKIAPAWWS